MKEELFYLTVVSPKKNVFTQNEGKFSLLKFQTKKKCVKFGANLFFSFFKSTTIENSKIFLSKKRENQTKLFVCCTCTNLYFRLAIVLKTVGKCFLTFLGFGRKTHFCCCCIFCSQRATKPSLHLVSKSAEKRNCFYDVQTFQVCLVHACFIGIVKYYVITMKHIISIYSNIFSKNTISLFFF